MGFGSALLGSYPKQLTSRQVAKVSYQAHGLSTHPKASAKVAQPQLKRYAGGVYYAPSKGRKKDRREAGKAYNMVVAYLQTPTAEQLHGQENTRKALSSLQAFGEGLSPDQFDHAMAPVSTASQSAQVAADAKKVVDGVKALRTPGLPVGGPTPPVDWSAKDPSQGSREMVQAWSKALKKEGELMAKAKVRDEEAQLGTLVAPALDGFKLAGGQRLGTRFQEALGDGALVKNLRLDSLYDDLVAKPFKRIRDLSDQLDDLLAPDQHLGDNDQAGLDDKIIQRSQDLMACVADTHARLALVAECLAQVLAQELPGRMSEELVQLSRELSTLASEGMAPNSRVMQLHQRAQEQYLLALGRRANRKIEGAAEAAIKQADGWLRQGFDPQHSGAVIGKSSEADQYVSANLCERRVQQARSAAERFAGLLPPADSSVPPTTQQEALQQRLDEALDSLPLTKGLRAEVPNVAELLLEVLPQDLDERMEELSKAKHRAQNATGKDAVAAHEDLRAQSEELMTMVIQYVQALAAVAYVLSNGVPREHLPFDEQRVIAAFAQSLSELATAVAQPQSDRMRNFEAGHEAFQASSKALEALRFKPGAKPTSPATASRLAAQRVPNASFYAQIDRELDDLLASDLVPSPRRPKLSTQAELEQFQQRSDEQWLKAVNNIASPGLEALEQSKLVVPPAVLQAVPATRLYAQMGRKGPVRRPAKDRVVSETPASPASKSVVVDEVQGQVPDSLFGAQPLAPKRTWTPASPTGTVSRANGVPRWSRTPSPSQSVATDALPKRPLRVRRDDVAETRLMPDRLNTRVLPRERSDADIRPLTVEELADAMGRSVAQTRAALRHEPQGLDFPEARGSGQADRAVVPAPRQALELGQADRPLAQFVRLAFEPRDGQQGLSDEQQALKQRLDSELKKIFSAPSPAASELHGFLADQRARLAQQRRELRAMWGDRVPADQLSAAARRLTRRIDRHLSQLQAVSRLLANTPTGDPVLGEAMRAAGQALSRHEARLRQPGSSLMKHRRAAVLLQNGLPQQGV